jgi:hypothetical protein
MLSSICGRGQTGSPLVSIEDLRDLAKVVIGCGSIWGLFASGGILISSFTQGINDTIPDRSSCICMVLASYVAAFWPSGFEGPLPGG